MAKGDDLTTIRIDFDSGTSDRQDDVAANAPSPPMPQPAPPRSVVNDPEVLQRSMIRRMNRRARINGQALLPCLPSLREEIVRRLTTTFATLGKPFNDKETEKLRGLVRQQLERGYAKSGLSLIRITWWSDQKKDQILHYRLQIIERQKHGQYENWVKHRQPPLFGAHPDARAMDLAKDLPPGARIADLGAGTGRNAIPLAGAGYQVDAVDGTASFVDIIRRDAEAKGVAERINVTQGDILAAEEPLPAGAYHMVLLSEVVTDLRQLSDLRRVFERADRLLAPGGCLLFNTFVTEAGYRPDRLTVELSQYHWSWLVTPENLAEACAGLPFELESDEDTYAYEEARQPSWPPTNWYAGWSYCNDIFGLPQGHRAPAMLRWLTYRKKS